MNKLKRLSRINSSKVQIILSIGIAWFIPIFFIVLYAYYSFQIDIESSINKNFKTATENSVKMATERMNKSIALSRKATTDKFIEEQNILLMENKINDETIYNEIIKYILRTYYRQKEISMVSIEILSSDYVFYNDLGKYIDYLDFVNYVRGDILDKLEDIDTYIGFHSDKKENLYIYRNLFVSREGKRTKIGHITLKLNKDYVFKEMKESIQGEKNITVYFNDIKVPIEHNGFSEDEGDLFKLDDIGFKKSDKHVSYSNIKKESDYLLKYIVVADNEIIYRELESFKKNIIGFSVLLVPIIIIISSFLYKKMMEPLKKLSLGINDIELGKLGVQVDVGEENDFDYLFSAFNSMSKQLYYLFEKVYKEEVIAKDAKIMSLRAQINPHFLNNTLELMNWQARLGDNESVVKMIEALSIMIDAALNRENKTTSPLHEELEYCDAYLYVISQRFKDRIKIQKVIDESLLDNKVPSLIIQPFLENAVKHGIEPAGQGSIKLEIKEEDDFIVIEVSNDGKKITSEDKEKIDKLLHHDEIGYSVGIRNINERLKLMFGEDKYIEIFEDKEKTVSKIKVPK